MGLPLRWPLGPRAAGAGGLRLRRHDRGAASTCGCRCRARLRPTQVGCPGLPRATQDATQDAAGEPAGGLLIHLGMSGALAFGEPPAGARADYDHFRLLTDRGCLWLTDPRRFGAVVWAPALDAEPARKLLSVLGPEPFDPALDEAGFHAGLQARRTPVKTRAAVGRAGGRRGQHLRLRGAAPGPHRPAHARPTRSAGRAPRACWRRCARCCAARSRRAARR